MELSSEHRPFSWQTISFATEGKAQVLLIILTMALFYLNVPVSHDSIAMTQHDQYQDTETKPATVNSNQPRLTLLFAPSFLLQQGVT